jgi:hypothetical protein
MFREINEHLEAVVERLSEEMKMVFGRKVKVGAKPYNARPSNKPKPRVARSNQKGPQSNIGKAAKHGDDFSHGGRRYYGR